MFSIKKSSPFAGTAAGQLLARPVVLIACLILGVMQVALHLQRPVVRDLPSVLDWLFIADWLLLLLYGVGYLTVLGCKVATWVSPESFESEEFGWRFFLGSLEAAALVVCVAIVWTGIQAGHARPVTDENIKYCTMRLQEPGLRFLAKNLSGVTQADDFQSLCAAAYLEDMKSAVKPPQSREELMQRFGSQ